jgi:hypothetical protein
MPIRIEFEHIPHPFKLCLQCNDALGSECVTLDPGNPHMRKVYACRECFGGLLHELGDGIMRMIKEQEKGDEL